ncbi:MAG: hypothetical protein ACYSU3_13570 [Planctomycetota bacterium]|jgi:hypothetical protein
MIVDCHTHINFAADDDVAASEHLEAAETVDACIVLANAAESSEEVNKKLSEYVGKHKRSYPSMWANIKKRWWVLG